jgi:hypothetical protein
MLTPTPIAIQTDSSLLSEMKTLRKTTLTPTANIDADAIVDCEISR